ncbi:MAG: glucose 1-dehydrogenase [bacterium]
MKKLENKVAIITGGASGIGKATAELYLKSGAICLVADINEENLDIFKSELSEYSDKLLTLKIDVSKKEEVEKMIDIAIEKFGKVDILVNNAGIMDNLTPIAEMEDELWDNVLSVNLNSVMYGTRKAVKYFLENNISGIIINVSSLSGVCAGRGGLAYTTSKHAVVGLTKNVAFMYGDAGIRCNAICPGTTKTAILSDMRPSELGLKKATSGYSGSTRQAEAEEIAQSALFLATEDSSFINGVSMVLDGGWSAY